MKKVVIDGFELNEDYTERLLTELKGEGIKNREDLERYFKDHWHTEDPSHKSHLFVCRHGKKRNFSLPIED